MSLAHTLISQITLSNAMIEIEQKRVANLQELMISTIEANYPLSSLVGNNSIRHKPEWGNDVGHSSPLSKCNLDFYKLSVKPSTFKKGSDLNSSYQTKAFNASASYVIYESDKEFLAIELNPGQ